MSVVNRSKRVVLCGRPNIAGNVSSSKNPPSELILINYEVNILVLRHNKNLFYKKAADYFEKEKGRNKA